jgi:hypothetical protein
MTRRGRRIGHERLETANRTFIASRDTPDEADALRDEQNETIQNLGQEKSFKAVTKEYQDEWGRTVHGVFVEKLRTAPAGWRDTAYTG